ncbi:amino acid adenylation domain-containing protein [Acidobacteriota bacterium]
MNYEKYNRFIGQAMMKNDITLQFSRGCTFKCAYCFKIWSDRYVMRSAENMFEEIAAFYKMGVRRFAFVDDLPNLNIAESRKLYQLIIKNGFKVDLHYVNGIRGDILTGDYIDLMVEAGTVVMDLALETTSPRLQKLTGKNLNLEKLHRNFEYIMEKYPRVILETALLHGIPTETEEEANASLEYIKGLKWIHFPYIHLLKIYPNTRMEQIALQHGISKEALEKSADLAYHEVPETLPFSKEFTRNFQAKFLSQYFLSKERLLNVLPPQMSVFTEDELVQAYNGYLPVQILSFTQLLHYFGLDEEELKGKFLPDDFGAVPGFNEKLNRYFPVKKPAKDALRVLLLDLSQSFTHESDMIYDVVEPPLGLMYILTHLNKIFAEQVNGKIAKSRIDFDHFAGLKSLLFDFKPDIIGVRTLNYYKDFFHKTISLIRQWGIGVPVIAGGPYATSSYHTMIKDQNIDLAVLGEGEITFAEIIQKVLDNNKKLPDEEILKDIPGIAFVKNKDHRVQKENNCEILLLDALTGVLPEKSPGNPAAVNQSPDLAYLIYTSGSTGTPKGVMVQHRNLVNQVSGLKNVFGFQKDPSLHYVLLASYTFDVSLMHIFLPFTSGAKLFLLTEQTRKDPTTLWQFIQKNCIDILNIVPAFMKSLLESIEEQNIGLKYLFVGGDVFGYDLYKALPGTFKANNIINIYGPTETTINAALYQCRDNFTGEAIPIGKPLPNYKAYILDENLNLVPVGVKGELCIGGDGTARGYLNRPELTNKKFLRGSRGQFFQKAPPGRRRQKIYTTGDFARWLPGGNIEFLGRKDRQVKIRGFRIETGEIETHLRAHKAIEEVIVIAREDQEKNKNLCAYYTARKEKDLELWPSIGDYFIWDDLMYYAMTHDQRRNRCFKAAINQLVKDKTVVEVGTGPDVILARFCVEAGAKKVYAVEILEEYHQKAQETVKRLDMADRLIPIHGDITKIQLPEKVDICLANQCGTIGSSEGAIALHNSARRFLKEDGVVIPDRCTTKIAAISLPGPLHENPGFTELPGSYVKKIFAKSGERFDLRLCLKNFPKSNIISNSDVFEHLDFQGHIEEENTGKINLEITKDAKIDGFILWLNLYTAGDEVIDTLAEEYVWLPLFVPVFYPGVEAARGDKIKAECMRVTGSNHISPDYKITGVLERKNRDNIEFQYDLSRNRPPVEKDLFYRRLFHKGKISYIKDNRLSVSELRKYLSQELPDHMIPSYFVQLKKMPLTSSGKVDIKTLPGPLLKAGPEYVAPASILEKKIAKIWSEVLNAAEEEIGMNSNFFNLGGHSLKATILISKLHKNLNVKVPLVEFFQAPTIRGISKYIKEAAGDQFIALEPVERKKYYALSSAQKRLYFMQQLDPAGLVYNMPAIMILDGTLDRARIGKIFYDLILRHESLRTCFEMKGNEPVQRIIQEVKFEVEYHMAGSSGERQAPGTGRLPTAVKNFIRPFDLTRAPLIRIGLMKLKPAKHIFILDMHHIITDGISINLLVKDFMSLYKGETLPRLKLQYKDYSEWQAREKETLKKQELFWVKEFSEEIPVLNLPLDYPRPAVFNFEGSGSKFKIARAETAALKDLAKTEEATLYMTLSALFNVLLSRLSGQEDIIVGTAIAARRHEDLQKIMGMFVNTLAMRNYPRGDISFIEFLKEVKKKTLAAFENQEYPFEELIEQLSLQRDASRNPLFDVMFSLHNFETPEIEIPGLKLSPYLHKLNITKFDLSFNGIEEKEGDLIFSIEYASKLFKEETTVRFANYFKEIVISVIRDPGKNLADIEMIPGKEKMQILVEFNSTDAEYPKNKTIHELFAEQVQRTPDNIAVVGLSQIEYRTYMTHTTYISYRELNEKSHQMAYLLKEKGVQPDTIVGLMEERSLDMVIGTLAILKAGGAYLPIDPEYPEERIKYMLEDSKVNILVKKSNIFGDFLSRLHLSPAPVTSLAYIIYTSGSTGRPKGVSIEHRNAVAYIHASRQLLKLTPRDIKAQHASICFDVHIEEVYPLLFSGGKLIILEKNDIQDIERLQGMLAKHCVTAFSTTTAVLNQLNRCTLLPCLDKIVVGGDVLKKDDLSRIVEKVPVYNYYGPTETTVAATYYRCKPANEDRDEGKIPIGKPFKNYQVYILDRYGNPLPIGVTGEIHISGAGVGRGYLNNPELTAEKFCLRKNFLLERPDKDYMLSCNYASMQPCSHETMPLFPHHSPQYPITPIPHYPIYMTGDLGRWLSDGNIEFSGRLDTQVKIRGFRIELGEIENRLLEHESIKEAVVAAREIDGKEKQLTAYIVVSNTKAFDEKNLITGLKQYLSQILPYYMIPLHFIRLEKIPLTPNGKIDWKSLPLPAIGTAAGIEAASPTLPGNLVEEKLTVIWSEVLGISRDTIGTDMNFFELGGHSIKATALVSKVRREFHVEFPLNQIFVGPTIRATARWIKSARQRIYEEIKPVPEKEYYLQSSAQKRLYFLDQLEDIGTSYNMPAALKLKGKLVRESFAKAWHSLVMRHETLRTSFETIDGKAVQRVHRQVEFKIEYYDFQVTGAGDRCRWEEDTEGENYKSQITNYKQIPNHKLQITNKKEAETHHSSFIIHHSFIRPFDLTQAPLLRVGLIPSAVDEYLLLFDMHHIIGDGTSMGILVDDFISFYLGEKLPPLRIQYKDFSRWQNNLFDSGKIKKQEKYWFDLFPDVDRIPRLNLPTDYPRPGVFGFEGDIYGFRLQPEIALPFKKMAASRNATLFMNILAVWTALLYRYTGEEDVIVGCGIMGRPHADLHNIIGMFVNSLAVRNHPGGEMPYLEYLDAVKKTSILAFENQDVQFEDLVDKLNPSRDPSRNPLFDVALVLQNFETAKKELRDITLIPLQFQHKTSKFDLTLFAYENNRGDEIIFSFEYYTALFKRETIERTAVHLKNVIAQVIETPGIRLMDIDLLTDREKQQLLDDFNDTTADYPKEKTLYGLFADQLEKTPDHIALSGTAPDSEPVMRKQHLAYKELNQKVHLLAYFLFSRNVRPDDRVGIMMESSLELAIALLAVLKAGAGYVPISCHLPEKRIRYMINDAGVIVVFSREKHIKTLNRLQWECESFHTYLCMDSRDIYSGEEAEKSELMNEDLWRHVAETAVDEITGGGWVSSYTGQPFSKTEMDEYGDNILKKLTPLLNKNMKVLEIGCASGITMYRIAPRVNSYYGTDFSLAMIEKNREKVKKEDHRNIVLSPLPAHQVHRLEEKNFDLVIMNSVIQCFHGHNYLRNVIGKVIDGMNDHGYLFIGDVMDLELKETLIRDLADFKRSNRGKKYKTKTDFSQELFISRGFFEDLKIDLPGIRSIEFSPKIYTIENELTKYRYDVLITIDKTRTGTLPKGTKHKYQYDLTSLSQLDAGTREPAAPVKPHHLAYLIYTSGSTGSPKGVMVQHGSVVNTLHSRRELYKMGPGVTSLQLFSYAFDGFVTSFFTPLISGARGLILHENGLKDIIKIKDTIIKEKVTHFISVPALFRSLLEGLDREEAAALQLKAVTLAGDKVSADTVKMAKNKGLNIEIVNEYGVTEAAVMSTLYRHQEKEQTIKIGSPIQNTRIYILSANNRLQPLGVPGELCIAGAGIARGYLNNPELTARQFLFGSYSFYRSYRSYKSYILYKSGDLARWHMDGNIELLGRIDHQVKIRGFRIELEEIESQLLTHEKIKKAVVTIRESEAGDSYLCAYYTAVDGGERSNSPGEISIEAPGLKEYLAGILPDYMVPAHFIPLEEIPETPGGKVDRKELPAPGIRKTGHYHAPGSPLEEKLVSIWADILGIEKHVIGIDDNFFELGGHSLKATVLVSRIQKNLDVKVPLTEIFKSPRVRALARFIKNTEETVYTSIRPVEEREYYPVSPAQKRMFILNRLKGEDTSDNTPGVLVVKGQLDKQQVENSVKQLIKRHETLRTSFELRDEVPVQKVHKKVDFEIPLIKTQQEKIDEIIAAFIRPFDLSSAPLLRVQLAEVGKEKYIIMYDIHHIISDGTSMGIFMNEFIYLYQGINFPGLRVQYKDFTAWQNRLLESDFIKSRQRCWLDVFSGGSDIPVLNMPTDFPRPRTQSFAGDAIQFEFSQSLSGKLKEIALTQGATLYMVLLAIYTVLLSRYSGQEDIVVGTPIAGRPHADLENLIGMFVNTLAMRNFPTGAKTFSQFLEEVKNNCLNAYENQDYQFDQLVSQLNMKMNPGRQLLFDTMFALQNIEINIHAGPTPGKSTNPIKDLVFESYPFTDRVTQFDIMFHASEQGPVIGFKLLYCTKLFKRETIEKLVHHFSNIAREVAADPDITISAIEMIPMEEEESLFTSTRQNLEGLNIDFEF